MYTEKQDSHNCDSDYYNVMLIVVKLEMKPLQPGLLLHLCIFHVYIHVHGLTTYEYVRTQVTTWWFSISTPNNRLLSARRDDRSAAASSCSCAPTTLLLLLFVLFVVLLPLLLLL